MTPTEAGAGVVALRSLPDDLQCLLFELADDCGFDLPKSLPISRRSVADMPVIEIGRNAGDSRDTDYVRAMIGADLPPLIVAHGRLIDGKHRLAAYRMQGIDSAAVIDATSITHRDRLGCLDMGAITGAQP